MTGGVSTAYEALKPNYERRGKGKPVLILHGWGASIAAMKPVADLMESIGYEAVSLDFPGFGATPEPVEPWSVDDYAAYTRAFIQEQGLCGCDVICHSFGGRVTIKLAAGDPRLFNRLVLMDAAGVKPKRGLRYYFKVYSYKLGKTLKKCAALDRLFKISEKQQSAGSEDYRALSGNMRATFVKVVNEDLTGLLDRIENETLLIWGSEDRATPICMAEVMEKRIKNAGLAVIPGAGHFSYADDYARFCAIIKALFLR